MDMQNKQIRQPGSQAELLRSSGIALGSGQRQSLIKAAGQHYLSVGSLLYCTSSTTSLCLFTMSERKKTGFILRRLAVVPGTIGCKAKCIFEVFHFRMQ